MEAIGTLAAGIAHEINTPTQYVSDNTHFVGESVNDVITFIKEMKTILQSDDQSVDELKEQLKAALDDLDFEFIQDEVPAAIKQTKEGISRISKIVSAMKDFSHPGATDISHADINRAIEATLLVSTNRWKFVADVETTFGDIPAVPCYIDEINQVILNLIVNAADAIAEKHAGTDEKGSIEITTRQAGNNVLISISDSGAGMPPEVKSRIFDPFFTTKEVGKGTGQGLSIGYDIIVNKHNGTLTCDSEAGAGTTFTLSLPLTTTN
jgi:signal transduction histidine kinase